MWQVYEKMAETLGGEPEKIGKRGEDHFYTEAGSGMQSNTDIICNGELEWANGIAAAEDEGEEDEDDTEAWPLLTKALLSTVLMGEQQQALDAIAAALTGAVKPILDKWAAARAALKEANAHQGLLKEKKDHILLRARSLKKKLVDSEGLLAAKTLENDELRASREREIESLEQTISHLEDKLVSAHSQHMKEVEVLTRESQAAENAVAHLVLEADVREKDHAHEITALQEKVNGAKQEVERLQEQLNAKDELIASLEQKIARVEMDNSSLDECLVDTINLKQALEYQLALHERVSS